LLASSLLSSLALNLLVPHHKTTPSFAFSSEMFCRSDDGALIFGRNPSAAKPN